MAKNRDAQQEDPEAFKTDPQLCEKYGIVGMTLFRWRKQGLWPQPDLKINGRHYTKNKTVAKAERDLMRHRMGEQRTA